MTVQMFACPATVTLLFINLMLSFHITMYFSGSPFLLGRCLWVGSRYAHFMSTPMIEQFLEATVSGLQPSQVPSIRISGVR
jgi:uncharacterized membrane protein YgdD (TMEM256/DUF423 family)